MKLLAIFLLILALAAVTFAKRNGRNRNRSSSSSEWSKSSSEECHSGEGNSGTEIQTTTVDSSNENATSNSPIDESSPPVPSSDSPNDESSPPVPSSDSPNNESSPPVPSSDSPNNESSSPAPTTPALSSLKYIVPVTEEDKKAVVQCHNNYRSQLALGNVFNKTGGNKMPTASNMREFKWDDGLAKFAAEWANKCTISHSKNGWAGESIAINGGTFTNKDAFEFACNRWWGELASLGFPGDLVLSGQNFRAIGHWSQMAWGPTDRIGCAMAKDCPNTNWKTYVVCWYYPGGNYFGARVYEAGQPCSKCNAKDKCINGLCSQ